MNPAVIHPQGQAPIPPSNLSSEAAATVPALSPHANSEGADGIGHPGTAGSGLIETVVVVPQSNTAPGLDANSTSGAAAVRVPENRASRLGCALGSILFLGIGAGFGYLMWWKSQNGGLD